MDAIVILGTGLAGYTLAREFRKLDQDRPLVLITNDDGAFYSKPMLSNALAKNKSAAGLVQQTAEQMAQTLDAEVVTHTVIDAIDLQARQVRSGERHWQYEQLVLALGASQVRLPLDGDAADDVLSVNTLEDYGLFRDKLEGCQRVAIMGPGLIGCEFANDLVNADIQVDVIGPDQHPLQLLMPEPAGRALQAALSEKGVQWHLQDTVARVDRAERGFTLGLNSGASLATDLVLSAAGLRPNTALAAAAGLQVNRGIVVDRALACSAPGVFALGDCAEIAGLVMPYVLPIMHATRCLAQTLAGSAATLSLPAMPVGVKTPAHPIVVSPAAPGAEGAWRCEAQEDGGQIARFESETGQLLGFALTGAGAVKQKMALAKELPPVLE